MEQHNYNKQHTLIDLVTEYEAMSQQGTVVFYEETVFSYLIDYYQSEKAYETALAVVDSALRQHCFSAFLYYKKAQLLSMLCHETSLDQALDAIERAESIAPRDLSTALLKTQLLARKQLYAEAFSLLRQIKESSSSSSPINMAEIFCYEGLVFEEMGEYESMYASWSQALLLHPRHPEILQRIWSCVKRSQKHEECISLFESILDKDPYCHLAWYYLGHGLSYQNKYVEAIDAYEYAFLIDNEFEEAYKECAANCLIINDYNKALECYEEALQYMQPDGDLLFNIGLCYEFQGNLEVALNFYEKAIDVDEYNDEVYYHIGKCMSKQEKWTSAIHFFKKAISLDNRQEDYFSGLALAYYHLEELEKAFKCFNKATELAPEQPSFWVNYATFLLNIDYVEEALDTLVEAEEYSYGSELLYCKSVCLYKLKQEEQAIDALAEALVENFEGHTLLTELVPEMVENPKYASVIRYYQTQ